MFGFIKRHWVAYLIGATVAIALGLAAAYMVYQVGTTPASTQVTATNDAAPTSTDADGMNALEGDAPAGTAAADTTVPSDGTDTATVE